MKNILFSLVVLQCFGQFAYGASEAKCIVEEPCGWHEEGKIDYCVPLVVADAAKVIVHREDSQHQALPSLELKTTKFTHTELSAISEDKEIEVFADYVNEPLGLYGSLTIGKLGYYISCDFPE